MEHNHLKRALWQPARGRLYNQPAQRMQASGLQRFIEIAGMRENRRFNYE